MHYNTKTHLSCQWIFLKILSSCRIFVSPAIKLAVANIFLVQFAKANRVLHSFCIILPPKCGFGIALWQKIV